MFGISNNYKGYTMNRTMLFTLLTTLLFFSCNSDNKDTQEKVPFKAGPLEAYQIEGTKMGFLKPVNVSVSNKGHTYTLSAPGFPETSFEIQKRGNAGSGSTSRRVGSLLIKDMQTNTHSITFSCSDVGSQEELFEAIGTSIMEPLILFDSLSISEGELVDQFETEQFYKKSCGELMSYLKKAQRRDHLYNVVKYNFNHTVDMNGETVYKGSSSEVRYGGHNSSTFIEDAKELLMNATAQAELEECSYSAHFSFLN